MAGYRQGSNGRRSRQLNNSNRQSANRVSAMLVRRGAMRSLVPRKLYNGSFSFTRTASTYIQTTSTLGFAIAASVTPGIFMTFTPTDFTFWANLVNFVTVPIPNAAEIAALWDRVKIDKVEITMSANGTDPVYNTTASHGPRIFLANDYTDGTTGNTLAATQEMEGCKLFQLSSDQDVRVWTVRPKFQRIVFFTTVSSSYEPASGFVSTGTAIPHYGTRIAVDPARLGTGNVFFSVKYFFTCMNVK